jgi:anti-sigma-K factor RskA
MSGASNETPEELNLLAGEYVLGVLEGAELRAVRRQAVDDPLLAGAIGGWERRFAPLLGTVARLPPPEALWGRIEQATAQVPQGREAGRPPPRLAAVPSSPQRPPVPAASPRQATASRAWPWKVSTAASLALAAGVAAFALVPSLPPQPPMPPSGGRGVALVAALTVPERAGDTRPDTLPQMANATGTARLVEPPVDTADPARAAAPVAGFVAAAWPDGTVVLTAFAPIPVPRDRILELWMQPPGAAAPRSLGAMPASGREATLPEAPAAGTELLVSLEPAGGSQTGAPSGPVVFAGRLQQVRR